MSNRTAVHCVYQILNLLNGKFYIGRTQDFKTRVRQHQTSLRNGRGSYIHKAMDKHGIDNFKFEVLVVCLSKEQCIEVEDFLISLHCPSKLYNLNYANRGHDSLSPETREKQRKAPRLRQPFQGCKHKEEDKILMSLGAKKRWAGKTLRERYPDYMFEECGTKEEAKEKFNMPRHAWYVRKRQLDQT